MTNHLVLVMADFRLGDWTFSLVRLALRTRMVGWENGGHWSYDRANLVVHLLTLHLVDDILQSWTSLSI